MKMNKVFKGLVIAVLLIGAAVPTVKICNSTIDIINYNKQLENYKLTSEWIDRWFEDLETNSSIKDATVTDKKVGLLDYDRKHIKCYKYIIDNKEYYGADALDIGDIANISLHDNLITDTEVVGTDANIDADKIEESLQEKLDSFDEPVDSNEFLGLIVDYGNFAHRNDLEDWHLVKVLSKDKSDGEIPDVDDKAEIYKYKLIEVYSDGAYVTIGNKNKYINCYGDNTLDEDGIYVVYTSKLYDDTIATNVSYITGIGE